MNISYYALQKPGAKIGVLYPSIFLYKIPTLSISDKGSLVVMQGWPGSQWWVCRWLSPNKIYGHKIEGIKNCGESVCRADLTRICHSS